MRYTRIELEDWFERKLNLNNLIFKVPRIKVGEVWFCNLGLNIGYEENGKGKEFLRPILILKIYSRGLFFGLPLTTKYNKNKYYFPLNIKNKNGYVILSQGRSLSSNRLRYKIYSLDGNEINIVWKRFKDSFDLPLSPKRESRG